MKLLIALFITCSVFAQTKDILNKEVVTDSLLLSALSTTEDGSTKVILNALLGSRLMGETKLFSDRAVLFIIERLEFWSGAETEYRDLGTPYQDSIKTEWLAFIFKHGITYDLGLREDGVVVWRKPK